MLWDASWVGIGYLHWLFWRYFIVHYEVRNLILSSSTKGFSFSSISLVIRGYCFRAGIFGHIALYSFPFYGGSSSKKRPRVAINSQQSIHHMVAHYDTHVVDSQKQICFNGREASYIPTRISSLINHIKNDLETWVNVSIKSQMFHVVIQSTHVR